MTAATAVRRKPLTIAEIHALPAVVPIWPAVGLALGLAESTTYALAARGDLPIEVIRLGRRRVCRTVDLLAFLGLNDDSARAATQALPVEPGTEIA